MCHKLIYEKKTQIYKFKLIKKIKYFKIDR